MRWLTLLIGLGLLWPALAAADWQKSCQSGALNQTNTLSAGGFICHDPAAATDAPETLFIGNCENVDVFFYDSLNGDATGSAGTHDVYTCPQGNSEAGGDTDAERRLSCQPVNNGTDTTLSATVTEIFGMSGVWLWVDSAAADNDGRIIVKCGQPSDG